MSLHKFDTSSTDKHYTHHYWVGRGRMTKVYLTLPQMTCSRNRTPDLLILSPNTLSARQHAPTYILLWWSLCIVFFVLKLWNPLNLLNSLCKYVVDHVNSMFKMLVWLVILEDEWLKWFYLFLVNNYFCLPHYSTEIGNWCTNILSSGFPWSWKSHWTLLLLKTRKFLSFYKGKSTCI